MSEEVSATIKVGVSYIMLSCITVFVVISVIVASQNINKVVSVNSNNVSIMQQSTLVECSGKNMSGAACYRICSDYQDAIAVGHFKIVVNANEYYSINDLINKNLFNRIYYFDSSCVDGTMWHVTLRAIN